MTGRRRRVSSKQPPITPYYTPLVGAVTTHKRLDEMTSSEGCLWLQGLRGRLQQKMQREREYLDRRAARGTHTPTDEAYENDQRLEAELLALLEGLERGLAESEEHA